MRSVIQIASSLWVKFWPKTGVQQRRVMGLGAAIAAVFSLAFAYTAQYGFGLMPCILCLYQRVPYALIILLGGLAALMARRAPRISLSALVLTAPLFLADTVIGFFQVGVERHWWRGTDECVGSDLTHVSAQDLIAKISAAPVVRCDDIQFEFLGITLAGYNAMWAFGLGFVLVVLLVLHWKDTKKDSQS